MLGGIFSQTVEVGGALSVAGLAIACVMAWKERLPSLCSGPLTGCCGLGIGLRDCRADFQRPTHQQLRVQHGRVERLRQAPHRLEVKGLIQDSELLKHGQSRDACLTARLL